LTEYVPYTWTTGDTITAARLNNLETQYADAKTEFQAGNWTTPTLRAAAATALSLGANAGTQWAIGTSGALYPLINNTYDLGTSTYKVKNAFVMNAYCDQVLLDYINISDILIAGTPNITRGTFDIMPSTGTDNVEWRLFRNVTTTGTRYINIFKGDGTAAATFILNFETGAIEKVGGISGLWGSIIPAAATSYDLGSGSYPFRDFYIGGKIWGSRLPISDNTYDIGSASYRMRHGYYGGNLYIDGYEKAAKNVMFKAVRTTAQSIPASTWTVVQFNVERFDPNGVYDSTTNYKFVPPVAGTYLIIAVVTLQTLPAGKYMDATIEVSGAVEDEQSVPAETVNGFTTVKLSTISQLNAGVTVQVEVYHNNTAAVYTDSSAAHVHFEAHLLSYSG